MLFLMVDFFDLAHDRNLILVCKRFLNACSQFELDFFCMSILNNKQ